MSAYFAIIVSIASTTQKFANDVRAQAIDHFIIELEKIGDTCWRFKNNSSFTKGKVSWWHICFVPFTWWSWEIQKLFKF